jgi:hypothetical protein
MKFPAANGKVRGLDPVGNSVRGECSDQKCQRRGEVPGQRRAALPATVDEHAEVPELLRDLVRSRDQPGHHPKANVDDECLAHGKAADQVVQAVSQQNQVAEWAVLDMLGAVAVVPGQELLEHEEQQESRHQREVHTEPVADGVASRTWLGAGAWAASATWEVTRWRRAASLREERMMTWTSYTVLDAGSPPVRLPPVSRSW